MSHKRDQVLVGSALGVLVVFAVAVKLHWLWLQHFDQAVQQAVTPLINPARTQSLAFVAGFGSPIANVCLAVVIMLILWLGRQRLAALWLGGAFLTGDAVALALKLIIARPRPRWQLLPDSGYSFPSGHVLSTTLLLLLLWTVLLPWLQDSEVQLVVVLVSLVWIGVISFSRIYLGAHYPSDVVASWLLAVGWWRISFWVQQRWLTHLPMLAQKRGDA